MKVEIMFDLSDDMADEVANRTVYSARNLSKVYLEGKRFKEVFGKNSKSALRALRCIEATLFTGVCRAPSGTPDAIKPLLFMAVASGRIHLYKYVYGKFAKYPL